MAGCTAIHSEVVRPNKNTPNGIPYFLPRRPFIITVSTPSAGGPPNITVAPGNAEPDLSKEFVLSPGINILAQNEFNITIANNGLLQSSQSTATSQVATFVQNAAGTAGMFAAQGVGAVAAAPPIRVLQNYSLSNKQERALTKEEAKSLRGPDIGCPLEGTSYQYVVYPETRYLAKPLRFICSDSDAAYTVTWVRTDHPGPKDYRYGHKDSAVDKRGKISGIFFRHELPYLVIVTGHRDGQPNTISHFIVMSPDESETDYFHVRRNFFANNTANITITDGVITGVDQLTQSEAAGLVGLPATYLSSYMTAVGQLFSGLTSISGNQQKLLQQMQATAATQNQAAAVAAAQYQACRKTVASFNFANMSAAQASAAAAAIQAACGSNGSTGTSGPNGN
jgi:hypothetical protein